MPILRYPDFAPLGLELRDEMHPRLALTTDGISEFTFSNLYLFRKRYQYCAALGPDGGLIISGTTPGNDTKFFMTPCGFPGYDILESLFKTHNYWKNIPSSLLESGGGPLRQRLEELGIIISEDRDNFDYLYLRSELAALSGKKFHKKKNLVNAFMNAWPEHEERLLEPALIPDAQAVLEHWKKDKGEEGDYTAAREALEVFSALELKGAIYYIGKRPAAYCLGEGVGRGTIFAIHFEKALDQYKGIFQYMNQAFATSLSPDFIRINREQDLGDEGLRQAKMTYRPVDFVKKYRAVKEST
jgi:hypothetical protein